MRADIRSSMPPSKVPYCGFALSLTTLVATFGLLPAAMSHAIGSDSQQPFAIVIVGGLIAALLMGIFILPTLYVWFAREGDKLPEPEASLES
jgi:cobalt-zinc-cadmium resistance protein CzcA